MRTSRSIRLRPDPEGVAIVVRTETTVLVAPSGDSDADHIDVCAIVSDALGRLVTEREAQQLLRGETLTFALDP